MTTTVHRTLTLAVSALLSCKTPEEEQERVSLEDLVMLVEEITGDSYGFDPYTAWLLRSECVPKLDELPDEGAEDLFDVTLKRAGLRRRAVGRPELQLYVIELDER